MARRTTRVFLFIACTLLLFLPDNCRSAWDPEDCPTFCECFPHYGLRWAACVGRHLYSIHTGVNEAVQALDLSNNSIASLGDFELREASLKNLKLLNVSTNAITEIGLLAFFGMDDLRVLDISNNHLYKIQSDTFVENKKLEVLELSGNNFNGHVPRLRSNSLASLGLAGCRISHLPSMVFVELPRLRALDISKNMMILVSSEVLLNIPYLAVLILDRNPWSCNSDLFKLQNQLKDRAVLFKDICYNNVVPQSKPGPKKFEKMISLENPGKGGGNVLEGAGRLLSKIKNWRNSWKTETTSERHPAEVTSTPSSVDMVKVTWMRMSPYLFLASGFIVGAALGAIVTYVLLRRAMSRSIVNLRSRSMRNDFYQRMNLLQHLWQNNEDTSRGTSECPGTPPPPYRDVVLHANRYPRPHPQTIVLGNNERSDNGR